MLTAYVAQEEALAPVAVSEDMLGRATWIDLLLPSPEEEELVERTLGIDVPTREEMAEIEVSSRLYLENGTLYMTATVLSGSDTRSPEAGAVTFILTGSALVTVRYTRPKAFDLFAARAEKPGNGGASAGQAFLGLLEAIVNRQADVLERIALEVDALSNAIFQHTAMRPSERHDFQFMLRRIGWEGDLAAKVRESLVSLGRLIGFLAGAEAPQAGATLRAHLETAAHDVESLADQASFLSTKIGFLLDATLGLINIEQNAIIRIFSLVAVMFMPPTLVASIYGMNFAHMPELQWPYGYPLALLLMAVSTVLPIWYFRHRRWL